MMFILLIHSVKDWNKIQREKITWQRKSEGKEFSQTQDMKEAEVEPGLQQSLKKDYQGEVELQEVVLALKDEGTSELDTRKK